jgi:hypothetical protein
MNYLDVLQAKIKIMKLNLFSIKFKNHKKKLIKFRKKKKMKKKLMLQEEVEKIDKILFNLIQNKLVIFDH